ncbi:MAG: SatD family protein [Spirochaetales bacterium]|nr:SatD family protein [Spirochaetales bacterium]
MNVVAVIADIVRSRDIEQRRDFQRTLKSRLRTVSERAGASLLSPYTLTLGDEFQAVYGNFDTLFTDIVTIIATLFPVRFRFALAVGPLSTEINRNAALEMDGPAFHDARALMETLKGHDGTVIRIAASDSAPVELINGCLRLLSNALGGWRENTIHLFHGLVTDESVDTLTRRVGITRRGVNKHIAAHHLHDYADVLRAVRTALERYNAADDGGAG